MKLLLLAFLLSSCVTVRIDIPTPVTVQDDCDSVDARQGVNVPDDDDMLHEMGDQL